MMCRAEQGESETNKETKGRKGGSAIFPPSCHRRSFPREKKGRVDWRERKDDEEQTYKLVHPAVVAAC
jgi:hypothetical protein